MDNDSVVEQIVRSLSFEVEAIPQDNVIHLTTTTKSAPLNVKIRVRKKEEAGFKHGILSLPKPDRPDSIPERVRLVSSDQTIMSFNVVMEADFQKPVKKPRKNILGIFKPSMCLGGESDDDDYAYLPSNSYTAKINKDSTSQSEGALTNFTLSKNVGNDERSTPVPKRNKDIFGKCKPGGCLDPPFGEDRQPYLPEKVDEQTRPCENATKGQIAGPTEKVRTSSIFSNKLFHWKRKSSNEEELDDNVITKETKTQSVLDLYQAGSLQTSATYSNSIMTYPPTLNSSEQLRIQEEKQRGSRTYSGSSKNSVNVHSGSYFIIPKKTKNVLEKNNTAKMDEDGDLTADTIRKKSLDQNNISKQQDLVDDEIKLGLEAKHSATAEIKHTDPKIINVSEKINYKDSNLNSNYDIITKSSIETKHSAIVDINGTETDYINPSEKQNNKDLNQNSSDDIGINLSSGTKLSTTADTHSTETDGDLTVDTIRKKSLDQNNISKQQDLVDDEIKLGLETKHSATAEIKHTDPKIINLSEKIKNKDLNQNDSADDSIAILNPLLTQIKQIESKNLSTQKEKNSFSDFMVEKQKPVDDNEYKSENDVEPDVIKTDNATIIDEISLVRTEVDHQKSISVKELNFQIDTEIKNTQQSQVIDENKSENNSDITIDAKRELSFSDLTGVFEENLGTIQKIRTSAEGNKDEEFIEIPTPIERETPLELVNVEEDDLQHIWKNETNPLTSDTTFYTENEVDKQDNIMLDLFDDKIDPLDQVNEDESFGQIKTQTVLSDDKLKELMQNDYESEIQTENKEMQSVISQTAEIDLLKNIGRQNALLANNGLITLDRIDEIDSVASEKIENISLVKNMSTSVIDEFENISDTVDALQQTITLEEERTEAGQIQSEMFSSIDPQDGRRTMSDNYNEISVEDAIYEFNTNKDKIELLKGDTEDKTIQPQRLNVDTTPTTEAIVDLNQTDEKHIIFDEELQVAKYSQPDLESGTYVDSKANSFDRCFPDHSSNQTEATTKHKARPILLNLAIQSYVGDDNQVIVKSFDADNIPQRYPQDSLRTTKRYLEADDTIQIPIGFENDLYIQIKNNTQKDISRTDEKSMGKDIPNKLVGNKYENELDHIKRNVTIAEDIRRILEAVYEKELLPLRNTISELKENMEMLTMHHMVLKGHMFVKKQRSSKIVPMYRKCGCMKK